MSNAWLRESLSEDEDVCPICIDLYVEPVSLLCKHNYCRECAVLLVKQKSTDKNTYFIPCPVCETETTLGRDKTLKKLRTNKKLKSKSQKKREKKSKNSPEDVAEIERMMSQLTTERTVMPKNIKLLQEFDLAIGKDGKTSIPPEHTGMISYGTEENINTDGASLTNWHAMIIGPQESPIGQVIYFLKIKIPDDYPKAPPIFSFTQPKVVMECVNDHGVVNVNAIERIDLANIAGEGCVHKNSGEFYSWDPSHTIADVLVAIRNNMHLYEVCRLSGSISNQSY